MKAEITKETIDLIRKVIEVAGERGAFKPDEYLTVGTLRHDLANISNSINEVTDEPNEPQLLTEDEPAQMEFDFIT